ncbi:MAG: hypothetical protein ACM3SR_09715 [Ignavibacteriales bacterium]
MTQGSMVLLTEGMSERYQIHLNLTDALELLWEECQKGGEDFEKMVRAWQRGDWEITIACMMLQGRVEEIQKLADSI